MDPPTDRVHIVPVDDDNPTLDVTVCGESPGGMDGEWADVVQDRAGAYPVPVANICTKCFPNLKQYQDNEVPAVALDF
jgi:hypothetical protein